MTPISSFKVLSMRSFLMVGLLLLASCVSNPSGVSSSTESCCVEGVYKTFEYESRSIPIFLESLIASNLSTALAIKGLQPVDENGDLVARVSYVQEDLPIAARYDDFDERVSEGGDVRFVAKIVVELVDAKSNETVFSGSIQRIHEVSPGEYMHTGRASLAIFEAFSDLLAEYPEPPKPVTSF